MENVSKKYHVTLIKLFNMIVK